MTNSLIKELNENFNSLVYYADEINHLNSGSASAIVIIHKDKVVTEHYSGYHSHQAKARKIQQDSMFCLASVRKSYIGFVLAYLLNEGIISSIDEPVTKYLNDLNAIVASGLTIRHLLTHTHGLIASENGTQLRSFEPGTNWHYNNEGIRLLEELIMRVTDKSIEEFIQEKVCEPLGFQHTLWPKEQDERLVGVINDQSSIEEYPLGAQFASAMDLAYWGYLHLKKGFINGKQVLPSQIFEMATKVQSPVFKDEHLPQNGFLWYVKEREASRSEIGAKVPVQSYQIIGITGALLLIIPQYDIVAVRMYNKLYNYGGIEHYLFYLREFGNKLMECLNR